MTVDDAQDARLDRIDQRLRSVEDVVRELQGLTKLAKPLVLLAGASLGMDLAPMLVG